MELSGSKIKKVLIFSLKKSFSHIFGNGNFFKNFLYFRREPSELAK